jgi:predicted  nucleic acid-binding Zn-ribbon protein
LEEKIKELNREIEIYKKVQRQFEHKFEGINQENQKLKEHYEQLVES